MVEFRFSQFGESFGTREMGEKLRLMLRPLLNGDERVVLDFSNVNVVTNSFADKCIAKLPGPNPLAAKSVLVAFQRRY